MNSAFFKTGINQESNPKLLRMRPSQIPCCFAHFLNHPYPSGLEMLIRFSYLQAAILLF